MELSHEVVRQIVQHALHEDIGHQDITSFVLISNLVQAEAIVRVHEQCKIAGTQFFQEVYRQLDRSLQVSVGVADGNRVEAHSDIIQVRGCARSILAGERVALNFLQHLCGIATYTAQFVAAVEDLNVHILDTRKTTPGLRVAEKYAVWAGGGRNHRMGLYDAVLIKDNHLELLAHDAWTITRAIQEFRKCMGPFVSVEVEVENLDQVREAVEAGADMIMLDNMPIDMMREAVAIINKRAKVEASGGITLQTVRAVAETGIDYISVGAITNSAKAIDISMDMKWKR